MKIKIEIDLGDALNHLSFLQAYIEMMREMSQFPDDFIMTSEVERMQLIINNAVVNQASLQDIKRTIKEIRA